MLQKGKEIWDRRELMQSHIPASLVQLCTCDGLRRIRMGPYPMVDEWGRSKLSCWNFSITMPRPLFSSVECECMAESDLCMSDNC